MSISFMDIRLPDLPRSCKPDLLHLENFFGYQHVADRFMWASNDTMLWMGPGLGKTAPVLTNIARRMEASQVRKALIIAPLRVAATVWNAEARKWSHLDHLRFSLLLGGPEERSRALFADADIFVCNYENINWLAGVLEHYFTSQGKPLPFDLIVYDEVTKLKKSTGTWVSGAIREIEQPDKSVARVRIIGWKSFINCFPFRIGMTGSSAPNGYIDLHGQYLVVDGGARLGTSVTSYRDNYFVSDRSGFKYFPSAIGRELIEKQIADITLVQEAENPIVPHVSDKFVDLPPKALKMYKSLEKDMKAELSSGEELNVYNRASATGKCLQICNGAVYRTDPGNPPTDQDVIDAGGWAAYWQERESTEDASEPWAAVHDAKLDALEDILSEANGRPVLVAYSFKPDAERIMKRFKKLKPVNLTAEPSSKLAGIIKKWQNGEIRLMIGHPASMGHGIDGLQHGGNIAVWFGPNWSLELWDQFNRRLARTGQKLLVSVIRILARGTVDELVVDRVLEKREEEESLKENVKALADGRPAPPAPTATPSFM